VAPGDGGAGLAEERAPAVDEIRLRRIIGLSQIGIARGLRNGCERAVECEVPAERVLNTWPLDDVLAWLRERKVPAR
jgi:hypothetical protein